MFPIVSGASAGVSGNDEGIFGYGQNVAGSHFSLTNLVSNAGVVATDVTGVGTARYGLAACEYGGDKGIFGYGTTGSNVSLTNLVSNVGVVGTDVTGVGTGREGISACEYGGDKGIFGFGYAYIHMTFEIVMMPTVAAMEMLLQKKLELHNCHWK